MKSFFNQTPGHYDGGDAYSNDASENTAGSLLVHEAVKVYAGRTCHRYKYADCTSTNELALRLLEEHNKGEITSDFSMRGGSLQHAQSQDDSSVNALIVRADYQSAGRGTHGRVWYGDTKQNLYLSIALKKPNWTTIYTDYQFLSCLAVLLAIRKLGPVADITLKYPNDLLLRRDATPKKLSGILIETEFRSQELMSCVCGIGINVNQRQFDNNHGPRATSLSDALSMQLDIDQVEDAVCTEFFSLLDQDANQVFDWWKDEVLSQKLNYLHVVSDKLFHMHSIDRNGRAVLRSADATQLISVDSLREFEILDPMS